ncbi:hypothetical protein JTB14_027677 [Gonioctena quinquepunctata]|nr:hypothetical protein JTB14_027677 [Gonioctena quinquepunctata]
MRITKIILYCFLSNHFISVTFSRNNNVAILAEIFDRVFSTSSICFVHDDNIFRHTLSEALILSNISLTSLSVDQLTSVASEDGPPVCSDSLISVLRADLFLKVLFLQESKTINPTLFRVQSRMIFVYENASMESKKLVSKLVDEFSIDVLAIEDLEDSRYILGNGFAGKKNLRVESLFKRKTILLANNSDGNVKVDWSDFKPIKWTPKFAPDTHFKISLFHCPPYWYVENGTVKRGIESFILEEITKGWPVKYYIEQVDVDHDLWNHTLGLVELRQRDAAVCHQWLDRAVSRNIDFTSVLDSVCATFLVKKPRLLPVLSFVFQPLQVPVYAASLATLLAVSALLAFMKHFVTRASSSDCSAAVFHVLRLYSGGTVERPRNEQGICISTLILAWIIFCLLSSTYYSAGLTSATSNPRVTYDINSLEDMVTYGVPWVVETDFYSNYFRSTGETTLRRLADLYIPGDKILDRTEYSAIYIKTLGNGYVTSIDDLPVSDWKYYKKLKECFKMYYAGVVLQKNSPFRGIFDDIITRITEGGFMLHALNTLYSSNGTSMEGFSSRYVDNVQSLHIGHNRLQGAFLLLAVGWGVSLFTFLIECWFVKWRY